MHILLLILFFVFLHRIIRLITRGSFRRNYGYNPYGYRRHRFGGGLFTLLSLVALSRLFTGRRW